MVFGALLATLPLWLIGAAILLLLAIGVGLGGALARARRTPGGEPPAALGVVTGALLGLLAFLLAFTFGMTAARFDNRRDALLTEVNAIGTAFLRADLMPEPWRGEARDALAAFVEVRVSLARREESVPAALARADALQNELWRGAAAIARAGAPDAPIRALYIDALNTVFDAATARITVTAHHRIPNAIWVALGVVMLVATVHVGLMIGHAERRTRLSVGGLVLAFGAVLTLIADLDRAGPGVRGLVVYSEQPMLDLHAAIRAALQR